MEIQRKKVVNLNYRHVTIEELLNEDEVFFTGFYLDDKNSSKYIYKSRKNVFLLVSAESIDSINDAIYKKRNNKLNQPKIKIVSVNGVKQKPKIEISKIEGMSKCSLSLKEIVSLYKYNQNIKVYDTFLLNDTTLIQGTYKDYLLLVKEIIMLEAEIKRLGIGSNFYEIIKFIYDKYKLEVSYWDPTANYGKVSAAHDLFRDKNRVVNHPYDYIGLIVEKYATCQGMAQGLIEVFRYFGIEAVMTSNKYHSMVKVYINDGNEKKVSYIDLSREVTKGFADNKYVYNNINGIKKAIPRVSSNRVATRDSYNYFLKADIGRFINDSELNLAIDYNGKNRTR